MAEEAGFLGFLGAEERNRAKAPESPLSEVRSLQMPPCDGFAAENVTGRRVPRVSFRDILGDSGLPD